jgi:hypothetical protein
MLPKAGSPNRVCERVLKGESWAKRIDSVWPLRREGEFRDGWPFPTSS